MTKQIAAITIGYDKYLLELSDAVKIISMLADASHLTQTYNSETKTYDSCIKTPDVSLRLAMAEEIGTAIYVEKKEG
jgi:hypothetical protein